MSPMLSVRDAHARVVAAFDKLPAEPPKARLTKSGTWNG